MDIAFLGAARRCIFRHCITYHPSNLVHLRLCQHSQGVQVGSICRLQFRPSDTAVWRDSLGFLMVSLLN